MKKVLLILAPGFEEIEAVTSVDILRRAGARVTMGGTQDGLIKGSRGIHLAPDKTLDELTEEDFDLVILPGGQPGTDNLMKDDKVKTILKKMNDEKKWIAAICAAPLVLQSIQLLEKQKITSHPSVKSRLKGVNYSENRVVVDENIVTSRSPGTAMEFALKLVEILFGKDLMEKVNKGVMANIL